MAALSGVCRSALGRARQTERTRSARELPSAPSSRAKPGGAIEPWHEFYSFMVDTQLLAECDGLVGKFTSNMDRVVYALMAGRARCHRPFVSLDAPFCFGGFGSSIDSTRNRNASTGLGQFPCMV